jgi:rhodanese-related sulfurtransferase
MGDYVNSRVFPSMIKPETLAGDLENNVLIIDLRNEEVFQKGHIPGAVNVSFTEIPEYFQDEIRPFEYEKIVIACYHGQMSSYTTALLRLMGYGNVYSLRWGMGAWNPEIATIHGWEKEISSNHIDKLVTETFSKPEMTDYPDLNTGLTTGEEIFLARIDELFKKGFLDSRIRPEELFENPNDYFVINYERRDKYESGHIEGAVRYKPNGTLGIETEMKTIPTDREVVVYCGTGHSSAFVTAYLRLFGYNARTLIFGNNGFMHDKMLKEKATLSWQAYGDEFLYNYPLERE